MPRTVHPQEHATKSLLPYNVIIHIPIYGGHLKFN